MRGKLTLYVDQYGQQVFARTVKELRASVGGGRVFKVYVNTTKGETLHVGYGVGRRWFTAYQPIRLPEPGVRCVAP